MSIEIIQQRLDSYNCKSTQEEENAIKEITQEVALFALSRAGFFKKAIFHGGTSLRIFHNLRRFSEDLDFALQVADKNFLLTPYLEAIKKEFLNFAYVLEVQDRSSVDSVVQKAFIKDDSIGKLLKLDFQNSSGHAKKIRIKLEVDTNPPTGGRQENIYHNFPLVFAASIFDKPSLFAGKLHAVLCRAYVKGRDWYDFLWYIQQKVAPNLFFLEQSLLQAGPWKGEKLSVDYDWLKQALGEKIVEIDWQKAQVDLLRFVKNEEKPSIELWSKELFLSQLALLKRS